MGATGANGVDGASAYDIAVEFGGYAGTVNEWLTSLTGPTGATGQTGANGADGADGADGVDGGSAYDVAVEFGGFEGTVQEWVTSLNGSDGSNGTDGVGLTNASAGLACAVDADADPLTDDLTGVYAWSETAAQSGLYLMVCDTNPAQ
jgi:integrin beta 8